MEEFSDLDDETGTNIVNLNNVEITRRIVEPIEYQLPDVNKTFNKAHINNIYSNLNNNIINFENPIEIQSFDNSYFSKRYIYDYDRIIDENLSNNVRNYEHNYSDNKNNYNKITENQDKQVKKLVKENPKLNRLIEIQKNYNKIYHKKEHFTGNNLIKNKENIQNKPLNPPENAFSSKK